MKDGQKGFAVVETLLILVIAVLVGGTGYYVWHAQKQTKEILDATSKSATSKPQGISKKQAPIDPTADWVAYTGTAFSLKYPKTWVMAAHPELCADNILLLGPNKDSVGHCGSEGFGEVAFTFSSSHGCFPLDDTYTDKTNLAVTISGMSGTKETGTAKATNSEGSGLQPAGTKVVQYCFNSTNKHYVATYNQQPAYPDVLSDFELIVTKTLKFQ